MRTYKAPGTVSSNLHNLTPLIFATRRGKLHNPPFIHKGTEPREVISLAQGRKTRVWQSIHNQSF